MSALASPRGRATWLALSLAIAVIVSACGGSDGPKAPPSASSSAPGAAGPTVRWVEEDAPAFEGSEAKRPFARETGGNDEWRLYVVRGGGEPELVGKSARSFLAVDWARDGKALLVGFGSLGGAGGSAQPLTGLARYGLAAARPEPEWEFLAPLSQPPEPSPDGALFAFVIGVPPGPGRQVWVAEPKGKAWWLDGLGDDVEFESWIPDGSGLLVTSTMSSARRTLYLVPRQGGPATVVDTSEREEERFGVGFRRSVWSPDGDRLAYVARGEVVVFDREGGGRTAIALNEELAFASLSWSEDGTKIAVAGGLVDVESGRLLQPVKESDTTIETALSPDGRWLITTTQPYGGGGPDCVTTRLGQGPKNRTLLTDLSTGVTEVLYGCFDHFHAFASWLPNGRLLLTGTICWQCDGDARRIVLVDTSEDIHDTEDDDVALLTDGYETGVRLYGSPDGKRLLLGGESVRLYTDGGELVREIALPRGFDIMGMAWSPDGQSFAYLVGPAGFGQL